MFALFRIRFGVSLICWSLFPRFHQNRLLYPSNLTNPIRNCSLPANLRSLPEVSVSVFCRIWTEFREIWRNYSAESLLKSPVKCNDCRKKMVGRLENKIPHPRCKKLSITVQAQLPLQVCCLEVGFLNFFGGPPGRESCKANSSTPWTRWTWSAAVWMSWRRRFSLRRSGPHGRSFGSPIHGTQPRLRNRFSI